MVRVKVARNAEEFVLREIELLEEKVHAPAKHPPPHAQSPPLPV